MLVSFNELKKYVDLEGIKVEEVASKLTSSGIEVENIKKISNATNLVIGQVLSCEKVEDSDHLNFCKVDIGNEILDIVCGAPNCKKDLKVIVAKIDANLNGFIIKKSKIKGIESFGMLCSLLELGVDKKTLTEKQINGIEELSDDAIVGNTNVLEYLQLDDTILDLSILANRSDIYSIFNLAREVGSLFKRKVNIAFYKSKEGIINNFNINCTTSKCSFLSLKRFDNIKVSESPLWLKNILRNHNINSVNNIIDITNYIMLLTGQPLNVYDFDKLNSDNLEICLSNNENFIGLNQNEYKLDKEDIIIKSNNNIVCLAGIMASSRAVVDYNTKNIMIESAIFDSATLRHTSNNLGIITDSSLRFIKGINLSQNDFVLGLISYYINLFNNNCTEYKTNIFDNKKEVINKISCTYSYINNRLGTNFDNSLIKDTLECLNFKIKDINEDCFEAIIPSFRLDISDKCDLSEEVLRYNGFDNISSTSPIMPTLLGGKSINEEKNDKINDYLINNGFYKVISYSLVNEKLIKSFNYINKNECLKVLHPLTEEHYYLRTNLLSSILETAVYNYNHQNRDFKIYEISQINDKNGLSNHLAICLCGNKYEQELVKPNAFNFYDIKGYFEYILDIFNISLNRIKYEQIDNENKEFHPYHTVLAKLDNKILAIFGLLHPELKKKYGFKKDNIVLLEMNLNILHSCRTSNNKFKEINKFPTIKRDYSILIDNEIKYSDLKNEIKKISNLINNVELFDIYNENLDSNKISLGIKISLEDYQKTLTEEEVSLVDKKIRSLFLDKFKAELR